jgi:hypothetical protein
MLNEWWRDLSSLVFGLGTVTAAILAVIALLATKAQAKQIEQNRQRSHERDTLKAVLDIALNEQAANPGTFWKPGMAYLRTLPDEVRATIPLTVRYFHYRWEVDLAPEAVERNPGNGASKYFTLGKWEWTPGVSILAAIYDELIAAINTAVQERS